MGNFAFREAGPHINDRPTGGEWLVNHQLEYQYPLIDETVGLVGFVDGGTLGTTIWEDDAWDWRLAAGLGIRLKIPMLGPRPLALDFGWPLLKHNGDKEGLVTFSIGRDF